MREKLIHRAQQIANGPINLIENGDGSVVGNSQELAKALMSVYSICQIMFDPENRPPQTSADEAWDSVQKIFNQ